MRECDVDYVQITRIGAAQCFLSTHFRLILIYDCCRLLRMPFNRLGQLCCIQMPFTFFVPVFVTTRCFGPSGRFIVYIFFHSQLGVVVVLNDDEWRMVPMCVGASIHDIFSAVGRSSTMRCAVISWKIVCAACEVVESSRVENRVLVNRRNFIWGK